MIEARTGEAGGRELDLLLHRLQIEIVSLSPEQAQLAREDLRKFGRGCHKAALNVGDCCSYALARYTGEPLLFKGDDFNYSDIGWVSW